MPGRGGDLITIDGYQFCVIVVLDGDARVPVEDDALRQPMASAARERAKLQRRATSSFEVAPPDKPDAFAPYLSWRAKKAK